MEGLLTIGSWIVDAAVAAGGAAAGSSVGQAAIGAAVGAGINAATTKNNSPRQPQTQASPDAATLNAGLMPRRRMGASSGQPSGLNWTNTNFLTQAPMLIGK